MPAGITAYGAYIPIHRLDRGVISQAWGMPPIPGEKAVANFDEDSITMAVAACLDLIDGLDRERIDGLYLATTTSPYREKQAAATVATAADLKRDMTIADFADSLRAGTAALRSAIDAVNAGSAKQILVAASDSRLGSPQTPSELMFGDGAAALLIGEGDVAVAIEASYNIYDEFIDVWRRDTDKFPKAWEDRFIIQEGYIRNMQEAISELLKRENLSPTDFAKVVYYAPDPRSHGTFARTMKFDPSSIQDPLFGSVGNTGVAYTMMMLVAALEESNPGDRILFANYGDGADAFILRVTDQIEKVKAGRRGVKGHVASKIMLPNYEQYASFRQLMNMDRGPGMQLRSSASLMWRDYRMTYRLHGAKCKVCGKVQFPIPHVCIQCQSRDQFEEVRLSDKRAELFTYTLDMTPIVPDMPNVLGTINFEGGGRMNANVTDRMVDQVKVGMPLEMTFRKLHEGSDFHNYFWKARPIR